MQYQRSFEARELLMRHASLQAAIEARLARLPLYTYSQLSTKHGVQKQSHRTSKVAKVSATEQQGFAWYNTLESERRRPLQRLAVKPAQQREGLAWYGKLNRKSTLSL